MPTGVNGVDQTEKFTKEGLELYKASLKWYWRLLAVTIAVATIAGAIFEGLSFFYK